jgi:hypothetical protein
VKLRTVTIKDPAGKKVTLSVPPDMSLDQMKKGSLLDVRYVEAEAVAIGKPGVPASAAVETVTFAPQGETPAEMTAVTKRVTGMVKDIDRMKRELTVTGPDKRDITLRVAADVPGFDQTKIGDRAAVQYTSAIAISAVRHAGNAKESRL